jgi:hypothetical protein
VLALDDGLVHAGTTLHVIGLDGEELLQRVCGAVGFHGPDLHLTQALTTELRLTTQRLLRDERVWPDAAGVDFVVHEVVQLEDVHDAHGDVLLERVAGAAVEEDGLTARRHVRDREQLLDLFLGRAVEDGRDARWRPFFQLRMSGRDLLRPAASSRLRASGRP